MDALSPAGGLKGRKVGDYFGAQSSQRFAKAAEGEGGEGPPPKRIASSNRDRLSMLKNVLTPSINSCRQRRY